VDGILAGVGGVLVFLPQILILFLLHPGARRLGLSAARGLSAGPPHGHGGAVGALVHPAAVQLCLRHPGHHGHAHHHHWRDRLVTIMIAPLMTCSARLPVYALLIGAFIPARTVGAVQSCRAW
jgi:ferrous iron transport protein B